MKDHALSLAACREQVRSHYLADEAGVVKALAANAQVSADVRARMSARAAELVRQVRASSTPTMMEKFLAQYGLTTKEGVALMCLAEALLRVPDKSTIDELIEDKISSGNWGEHRGRSSSSLINSSTWALLVTGKLLSPVDRQGLATTLRAMIKRLGEPVVRTAVGQAMKEMGRQFVLGRNIEEALKRANKYEERGYTYSYDMLGEAARTDADALRYHKAYSDAIKSLASHCKHPDIRQNPGISVKLSALHARYEFGQKARVMNELVPRTLELAKQAKAANMGFNIDAEEADRLDLSLDVIEAVLSDPALADWDGFGIVVQAFGKRAAHVLDWLYALADKLDRRIMVRLVKGAYWDAEIKRAQVMGLADFPVFTRKVNSDLSYIACAKKLLGMTDRIYPQFATHNAHSVSAILELAQGRDCFEFQRLHGMGESLHDAVLTKQGTRCRIYAPVGAHQDLLAYLVRRLLENGANSSFVNQIVDTRIQPEDIARDPFDAVAAMGDQVSSKTIARPADLYGAKRRNARGWDITNPVEVAEIEAARAPFKTRQWTGGPVIAGPVSSTLTEEVRNPAVPSDLVGHVTQASKEDIDTAIAAARTGFELWSALPVAERCARIRRVADLFEEHAAELFALATREAGKTLLDGVAEIREAVDFARYYPNEAERNQDVGAGRGVIACISPWNFPLAIFAGQVLAGLAAGNAVIAKPAGQTALIASRAVELMHEAGIPREAIQLLPGSGSTVGAALTSDPRIDGVCFTGSTATAQRINKVMAESMAPDAPLVAETGGLNAMIVDSTALPEQVVRDVLASSFQSAGQRCSALRMLYVQKDIADHLLEMLFGAMDELRLGNPWQLDTDVGPVIDENAKRGIEAHCEKFARRGRVLKQLPVPAEGLFVAPTVIKLEGIHELEEEIFGPVLHVATFEAHELDQVVDQINAQGFGLTFGLHTRVDKRVERITGRIKVGNIYVNRNQIGAIVGSQPFGGEGLSGTGPKAGGPQYVRRFMKVDTGAGVPAAAAAVTAAQVQEAIGRLDGKDWARAQHRAERLAPIFGTVPAALDATAEEMPGPTGELNRLRCFARGTLLCLGPDLASAMAQAGTALSQGNAVVVVAPGASTALAGAAAAGIPAIGLDGLLQPAALESLSGFEAVASHADTATLRQYRLALARRDGALLPLITEQALPERFVIERHLCVDTTAAGGNASLIAASE
ncbi:bifunctional proline dehydrogenase/L-glutamate gamma-semialdehyde dehydrogenase [Zobellella denitrificans]|uniref:bifunctional proline dehydrogenase/L-glutamate gamma-semialdehyde dehydrogenase PutA n=1 Tax=Zobellella denitrificans TaxID=347534 RepID=UPI000B8BD680|nr:bifunctional proline dehydrogenase/L-glutamate gamma-semialdehyde dehydrogenase PutA [Zobellella denitrificans]OXS16525.1 bifunctional proline dehydrogenase/L-glutamate gamma-semialdehyde dehydrogenase [Zobellella denitrificans]